MEEKNKSGYTAEGRKLRPRRPRISSDSRKSESSDNKSYSSSERKNYGEHSERRFSGGHRDYDSSEKRNSYGRPVRRNYNSSENRGYGSSEGRNYGDGERRGRESYGEHRSGYSRSERRSEGRDFGERRSFRDRNSEEGRGFRDRAGGEGRNFRRGDDRRGFGNKKQFGGKRRGGFGKNPYHFGESSEEGINRMISRKPQLDQIKYSDSDLVPTEIQEEVRLNKFIANSGVCSRREADQFIEAGVVTVNGEVVTELGTKVNVLKDEVRFNNEPIKGEPKIYIVMNKPKGFVTTASDSHAEKTVMDLLKGLKTRVFPVGRLDKNTTGVLMFTNDGELAEKLTHPSYDKKKIYQVILERPISEEDFAKMTEGLELNDGPIKADELEYIDAEDHRKIGIEIHSGKNRIVRRMFEFLGYDVKALDRVYFAGLTKKGLKKGEWRILTEGEANVLKMGAYV